jgi:DNA-binding transcriptional LysR family regulator
MNDGRIDLNLIEIFSAVMTEKSVTRAARRLSMTQPAVSNALARLRQQLHDELFTKVRGGVQPTERAIAIWPDIREALEKIRAVSGSSDFDPATTQEIFHIAVTDALRYKLVPALALYFAENAPCAKLHMSPHTDSWSLSALEAGRLDCVIGMFPQPPPGPHVESLFTDTFVCVLRKGHPLLRHQLTLKGLESATHVLIKTSGASLGLVDNWLGLQGLTRHIALIVGHIDDALEIVRQTDMLTAIPYRVAWMAAAANCRVVKLPFDTEKILYKMLWHEKSDRSTAQKWFRATVKSLVLKCNVSK